MGRSSHHSHHSHRQPLVFVDRQSLVLTCQRLIGHLLTRNRILATMSRINNDIAKILIVLIPAREDDRVGSLFLSPRMRRPMD